MSEANVRPLFSDVQPGPAAADVSTDYVAMARAVAAICATRILLLIAVLTGAAIWAYTTWEPTTPRLYVAVAFSLVFVLPQVALYYRRG